MKRNLCFITAFYCLTIFFTHPLNAQQKDVFSGRWYSPGNVNIKSTTNNYLSELILKQKGNQISGQFNYYFRDSLFINEIEGYYDSLSGYVFFKPIAIIFHGSTSTKTGVDCNMRGEFVPRIMRLGSFLGGRFTAGEDYRYTCPDIEFDFYKSDDMENSFANAKQEDTKVPYDTLSKDSLYFATQKAFNERPKEFSKSLLIKSNVIKLELTDNGAIDYDSISIFFNNRLILKKTLLTHVPIKLALPLNKKIPFNELGMFANNVGKIPPNTATIVLIDGDDTYEFDLNSSLNKTATIKLYNDQVNFQKGQ